MRKIKLSPKARRGPKHPSDERVSYGALRLPDTLLTELRLYRDIYSDVLSEREGTPVSVTFDQMLRRWMDNVGRFDAEMQRRYADCVRTRRTFLETTAEKTELTVEQIERNMAAVDPTEGEIWEIRHFFERDGDELDAIPGDLAPFYAVKDGRNVGIKQLFAEGWILMNDAGVEIDYDQAAEVSRILKEHRAQETLKGTPEGMPYRPLNV